MDRSQLLRGTLDAATLAVVAERDGYGYDVLRRLYRSGALTSYVVPSAEGPHRRYYGITDRGWEQLREAQVTWDGFARAMGGLLGIDVEVTR